MKNARFRTKEQRLKVQYLTGLRVKFFTFYGTKAPSLLYGSKNKFINERNKQIIPERLLI